MISWVSIADNTFIEYDFSPPQYAPGDGFHPDGTGKQHTNGPMSIWYRINEGEWKQSNYRSMHKFRENLYLCENIDDFNELMKD